MQIFEFRNEVVADHKEYRESFISIADPPVGQTVDQALRDGLLWRDPFGPDQPNFAGKKIDDLIAEQLLHPEFGRILGGAKRKPMAPASRLICTKKELSDLPVRRRTTFSARGPNLGNRILYHSHY
jgi:hypothetical protein